MSMSRTGMCFGLSHRVFGPKWDRSMQSHLLPMMHGYFKIWHKPFTKRVEHAISDTPTHFRAYYPMILNFDSCFRVSPYLCIRIRVPCLWNLACYMSCQDFLKSVAQTRCKLTCLHVGWIVPSRLSLMSLKSMWFIVLCGLCRALSYFSQNVRLVSPGLAVLGPSRSSAIFNRTRV